MTLSFYTQAAAAQEKSKSMRDLKRTRHEGTDPINAAVRQKAKEIKGQLGEMNQSIDTLASSRAANQSSRGMFFSFTMAM